MTRKTHTVTKRIIETYDDSGKLTEKVTEVEEITDEETTPPTVPSWPTTLPTVTLGGGRTLTVSQHER